METKAVLRWLGLAGVLLGTLMACGPLSSLGGNTVTISIVYGSEKEDWLEQLVAEYNALRRETAEGAVIVVQSTPMGSIDSMRGILDGTIQPTVWSPASDLYVPLANSEWRQTNSTDLIDDDYSELVLSPVVIAMWRPMAEALGWPQEQLGWADIAALATSDEGWAAYGFPEWGAFKFGHTHPDYSNSGFVAVVAEAYAGAGKQRDLSVEDVEDEATREFVAEIQSSIIHYGESTGFFGRQMFERGPSYLSAAVLYENLVVDQEAARLSGQSQQLPVVAIYPAEGTFWSNHPYIILNAPWVSEEQRAAAQDFEAFLLEREQQEGALAFGFRPADPSVPLGAPIDAEHGADPAQPQTVLEVPSVETIIAVQQLWAEVKKPVDLVVVMDVSGSMSGQKINAARNSLMQFVNLLDDRDRLQIVLFNEQITTLTPLTELGPKREEVVTRVSGISEFGGTRLYDGLIEGYNALEAEGDPGHIRAVVVLSDGVDTDSATGLSAVLSQIGNLGEEGGNATKVFTIAFGRDADLNVLGQISDSTGARAFEAEPETINEIYQQISTFF